jgi:hypothetical protein
MDTEIVSESEKATHALSSLEEVETQLKSISISFHALFAEELVKLRRELVKLL